MADPPNPPSPTMPGSYWRTEQLWLPHDREIQRATNADLVVTNNQINKNNLPGIEIGSTGLKRWGGRVYQEFLPELRGLRGMRVYDEMRKSDPVIGAILNAVKSTIRSVSWKARPKTEDKESYKWAEFLDQCLDDMRLAWSDVVGDVTSVIAFGWSLFEVCYKVRAGDDAEMPSEYDDGLIGWDKLAFRSQESLYIWDIDNYGEIHGMVQMPPPDYRQRYLPIEKCVLFRLDREANNPEGVSMLRPAYRPWYYKKNLEEVEGMGIERDFTGMMVITLPVNATEDDHRVAQSILERAKQDEMNGVILNRGPDANGRDDWDLRLISSPGSKSIDSDKAIHRYASEIATTFLAQFLQLGTASGGARGGGSYALSRSHKDFFYLAVQALVDSLNDTAQRHLVTPLMRLNQVPVQYRPTLAHGRIAPREIDSLIAAIDILAKDGLLGPVTTGFANFLRSEMDVPEIPGDPMTILPTLQEMEQGAGPPESPVGPVSGAPASRTG